MRESSTFRHFLRLPSFALLFALTALALSVASCTSDVNRDGGGKSTEASAERGASDEAARLVRVVPVTVGPIRNEIETSADLEAELWADLHPRASGFVRRLLVEEGDAVDADDILAALDDDQARLRSSSASLRVVEMERDIERQAASIAELERRVEQQALLEARKEEEYGRAVDIPEGVLSEEEIAQKRYEYEDAKIARGAAELALRAAKETSRVTEVRLSQAKVDHDLAELDVLHTEIRAPIPGVIAERNIRVGARVGPENKAFTLVNTERLIAYVHVPQREVRFVRDGQSAEVRCDAVPGTLFIGRVRNVSPVIDDGNIKLTLEVDNPDRLLMPGMFLSIRVILDEHESAILVPKKAILHDRDRPYFFTAVDGIARRIDFRPGYRNREFVEVLLPDDAPTMDGPIPVIIRGQENLKDGAAVRLESAAALDDRS